VSSWHTLIADNDITGDGIQIQVSENNTILGNNVTGGGGGIGLWSSSNGNVIAENSVRSKIEGVTVAAGSINNIITENIIQDNGRGFFLDSLSDNLVYHNNFINNSNQALANSNLNEWDYGYPSGGNYWSDYVGNDLFSGPNQDQLGSDGIGDTPYSFTGDMDRYPLLYPFEVSVFRRPTMLDATLSGNNSENVTIKWSLSPDDGGGLGSVNAYRIYRNSTYDLTGMGYQLIATLPNGTYDLVDNFTGEGDPNNYFYIVCAVNLTNVFTCAHDQAGKFTRTLSEGPNLVSTPLSQSDESIEVVLQTLSFDRSWFYDSLNQQWESYVRSKPHIGELSHVNHTMGLWVNVTATSNLTVAGVVPSETAIQLSMGWNLAGFPSFNTSHDISELKSIISSSRIEGYEPLSSPYYLRELGDLEILEAGYGYWICVNSETTWVVRSS
jgi:parallel beta-helix repeat protein